MDYYAGIDVSLRSCALCLVDSKGTVLLERELRCEVSDIAACLGAFPHPIERIGFEAGTMSQHLFHGLKAEGFDVVGMEARQVNAALSAMRNKTDRTDARGIAQATVKSASCLAQHSFCLAGRALPGPSAANNGSRIHQIVKAN